MAALILVILGLGLILGLVKPQRISRFLLGLVFGPVLVGVAFTVGREALATLSPIEKLAFVLVAGLAAVLILLRLALPRDVWAAVVGAFIHDILKFLVVAPFRVFRWLLRLPRARH